MKRLALAADRILILKKDQRRFLAARRRAFTLIELMIVVAIIGLVAAMGLPALDKMMIKRGMRKAVGEITDVCKTARARAIFSGHTTAVLFQPADGSFSVEGADVHNGSPYVSSTKLPEGVQVEALGVNGLDYTKSDWVRIFFSPNGTSDEMVLVLHSLGEDEKISLEFATGYPYVSELGR